MINDGKKMNPFCRISLWARCGGEVNQQLQQKPKEVERERERTCKEKTKLYRRRRVDLCGYEGIFTKH
jgi:hypothetical protein